MITALFWTFSGAAILSALLCISRRSPVASALWLVVTLFALAGNYVLLDAQFIAVLQVLVYAGAIMVLFLFVIMLLNLGRTGSQGDLKGWIGRVAGAVLGAAIIVQLWPLETLVPPDAIRLPPGQLATLTQQQGAVGIVSQPLFKAYLVPFEITSLLLLAAVVGAVVLAKRKL
jgi:NADH-quinone oxidoreductase subunit J